MMEWRNPSYNRVGTINCEVLIDGQWVPFTASPNDSEAHGRAVHAAIVASGQPIAAYVGPSDLDVERMGMVCSRFQAKAALAQAGLLATAEQAVAGADTLVGLAWAEAVEFSRSSPAITTLGAAVGLTDAQLDDLFRAAMQIQA